jgi:Tol biopolymer transport system component/uncharacterized Zn finger protein (UPF0148 family)
MDVMENTTEHQLSCQSCGAPLMPAEPMCTVCGAKTAAAFNEADKQRAIEARLVELPAELAERIRELERQLSLDRKSVAICVQLSAVYQDAGIKDCAIRALECALKTEPDNKHLHQKLQALLGPKPKAANTENTDQATGRTSTSSRVVMVVLALVVLAAAAYLAKRVLMPSTQPVARYEKEDAIRPRFSAAGDKVAFIQTPKFTILGVVDLTAGATPGKASLQVKDLGNGGVTEIATIKSPWLASAFAWRPGAAELLWVDYAEADFLPTLWKAPAGGGTKKALANTREFAVSPDGARVAYVGAPVSEAEGVLRPDEKNGWLYLMDVAAGGAHAIDRLLCSEPEFSPDGRYLVFRGNTPPSMMPPISPTEQGFNELEADRAWARSIGDLYRHDLDTGETTALTDGGNCRNPHFTPDGAKIAYLDFSDVKANESKLYVMNADGADARVLLAPSQDYVGFREFAFHPSGRGLVFEGVIAAPTQPASEAEPAVVELPGTEATLVTDLFAVGADGNGARRLPSDSFGLRGAPSFSPDGKWLAFEAVSPSMRREAWVMRF